MSQLKAPVKMKMITTLNFIKRNQPEKKKVTNNLQ